MTSRNHKVFNIIALRPIENNFMEAKKYSAQRVEGDVIQTRL